MVNDHYHVLKLRYVVMAVDPLSLLSPKPVLDLFRNELNMTIITWTDGNFADWRRLRNGASKEKLEDDTCDDNVFSWVNASSICMNRGALGRPCGMSMSIHIQWI
jgi:hypothetical protein